MAKQRNNRQQGKQSGSYFIFIVLILYVTIATSAYKGLMGSMQGAQLDPTLRLLLSLGSLGLMGGGLLFLNKWVQKWLAKKRMD